jgi:hypothetical protein
MNTTVATKQLFITTALLLAGGAAFGQDQPSKAFHRDPSPPASTVSVKLAALYRQFGGLQNVAQGEEIRALAGSDSRYGEGRGPSHFLAAFAGDRPPHRPSGSHPGRVIQLELVSR